MNRTSASAVFRTLRLAVAGAAVVAVAPLVAGGQSLSASGLPEVSDTLTGAISGVGALVGDDPAPVVASDAPGVAQRVARLMVEHDCWAGEAPDDVERPGHAVVTVRQGDRLVTRYGGARLTDRALEHVFGAGDDRIFMVHGFCR